MLKKRVITGLWISTVLTAVVWFGDPWFTIFIAIWGLLSVFEFYQMGNAANVPPLTYFGLIWTLFFILSHHFDYDFLMPLLLTSAVILSLLWLLLRPRKEGAFVGWSWTMAGILYVGLLLGYFVALRLDGGRNWVSLALFTTFGSDIAAFFTGRVLGRHHLAPDISPGKTWEGTLAGIFGAVVVSLLFTISTPLSLPLSYGQAILLGILVSILGQLGDLIESLLKRNMGVKDSGRLIPGHGGALDRIDSIVFAGITVYFYMLAYNAGWLNWL